MFKKMTVLAMAVGVVAALALPASASAEWRHKGAPIVDDVDISLTGNARFQGVLGGVECQVTSTVTFFAKQTTGAVDTFGPDPTTAGTGTDTNQCKGLGGLAFCQVHNLNPTELPWTIHTSAANQISITVKDIHSTVTGGFCPLERVTLTAATVVATGEQNPVENVQLSGTMTADLQTRGQCNGQQSPEETPPNCKHKFNGQPDVENVTISGKLQIEETAKRNTYEI